MEKNWKIIFSELSISLLGESKHLEKQWLVLELRVPGNPEMYLEYNERRTFKSSELDTVHLDASGKCFVQLQKDNNRVLR
jgi:hypothetical protein